MKVDNYTLEQFLKCPAKYDLRIRQQWDPRFKSGALLYGTAVHKGLEAWYRGEGLLAAFAAIEESWSPDHPTDDFRTLGRAKELMTLYAREYPRESWKILQVEVPFCIDTGMTTDCGEPIEYGGIYDLLVSFGHVLYAVDHKTTSMLGPQYMLQFNPNNQMTGYTWGAQQMSGQKVQGVIINAMCTTSSGKMSFQRQPTSRTAYDIQAWLRDLQKICSNILKAEREEFFYKNTTECVGKYGACPYHSVHVLGDPEDQRRRLESDYVKSVWDFEARF